ncbi:glucose PTS transporter transcription antiterminator GlcT [Pseudalkalibacillus caeni]|uniref:PRD domain-containing protein n=1 Tax=Exobacillus caeni TaxID=2574798 RepID=A0A5R9F6J6_9BACL|nr:PRD domain-containing protein [Pseudalkalibacillus caeni]TLS39197.1 PRD domain-containing protein [Pseudalkalibacillus caeni]
MKTSFEIKKALNNNVVIARTQENNEVVLTGKGIGFGKQTGDYIQQGNVDKFFMLVDKNEQEQYKQLVGEIDESFIAVMNDVISLIEERLNAKMDEHIHIGLTDHLHFALKRIKQGLDLKNPFLVETQTMYPTEYTVAEQVIQLISQKLSVLVPEGEIGFVALHIHSAISHKSISEINKFSQLISKLISLIEDELSVTIDRKSIDYLRLVRHLRNAIERGVNEEQVEAHEKLAKVLKEEYPLCYNLSWKLVKIMQQTLKKQFADTETVYLTMHLQRLAAK